MYIDKYYLYLVLPAFIFSLYAQFKVRNTFNKYKNMPIFRGITGAEAARRILDMNGLYNVSIEMTRGELTDHYDPQKQVLRLSGPVYSRASISAVGVAAHEAGHAIQHKVGYGPLALRTNLVPVANIGSSVGPYLAILGLILGFPKLANFGILLFTAAVAFYLVTLPVEFNASKRAVAILEGSGIVDSSEIFKVREVLKAAAMTYAASAVVAMANLLRLVLLVNDRRK